MTCLQYPFLRAHTHTVEWPNTVYRTTASPPIDNIIMLLLVAVAVAVHARPTRMFASFRSRLFIYTYIYDVIAAAAAATYYSTDYLKYYFAGRLFAV